jgi:hypothetical protein
MKCRQSSLYDAHLLICYAQLLAQRQKEIRSLKAILVNCALSCVFAYGFHIITMPQTKTRCLMLWLHLELSSKHHCRNFGLESPVVFCE